MAIEHAPSTEWDEAKLKAALNPFLKGGRWAPREFDVIYETPPCGAVVPWMDARKDDSGVWVVEVDDA